MRIFFLWIPNRDCKLEFPWKNEVNEKVMINYVSLAFTACTFGGLLNLYKLQNSIQCWFESMNPNETINENDLKSWQDWSVSCVHHLSATEVCVHLDKFAGSRVSCFLWTLPSCLLRKFRIPCVKGFTVYKGNFLWRAWAMNTWCHQMSCPKKVDFGIKLRLENCFKMLLSSSLTKTDGLPFKTGIPSSKPSGSWVWDHSSQTSLLKCVKIQIATGILIITSETHKNNNVYVYMSKKLFERKIT